MKHVVMISGAWAGEDNTGALLVTGDVQKAIDLVKKRCAEYALTVTDQDAHYVEDFNSRGGNIFIESVREPEDEKDQVAKKCLDILDQLEEALPIDPVFDRHRESLVHLAEELQSWGEA